MSGFGQLGQRARQPEVPRTVDLDSRVDVGNLVGSRHGAIVPLPLLGSLQSIVPGRKIRARVVATCDGSTHVCDAYAGVSHESGWAGVLLLTP